MSKGDNKSTHKANAKPDPGSKHPVRRGAKRAVSAETDHPEASTGEQPQTVVPRTENKPKAQKLKPGAAVPVVANPDEHTEKVIVPETTNMEVHHHPQLDHKPKPFKEYLLEGFMIFIAVMMGFIAENIREAIDNNEHVQQLTSQLARDLRADTAEFNEIYAGETKIKRANDTLIYLLQQPLQKADTRRVQKLLNSCHSMWLFHQSSGAMAAIKNELHLKQFSNSDIISYFAGYEKHIDLLHTAQDVNLQYQRIYLDPFITQHFTSGNMVLAFTSGAMPTAQMRNLTQNDLDQLSADMVLIRVVTDEMIEKGVIVKADATAMLKYITKQYDLEGK